MDLYIIGAGDVGGFIAHHISQFGSFKLRGFLDDNTAKHNRFYYDKPVIGGLDFILNMKERVSLVIAIADPKVKASIYKKLENNNNFDFPNFIHPSVWLGNKVTMGRGNIFYPGAVINFETKIEDFVTINMNAAIGHTGIFESFSTLSPGVSCRGYN